VKWYMGACPVCRGAMHDDLNDKGWVTCFSCARSFRAVDLELGPLIPGVPVRSEEPAAQPSVRNAA
jgi:hypothetical protein